ncbi:hypothetical protein [Duffyella gerundensis]|uniref:hypothetical protein n=1 Tax=Duffyella TaxID=3026546 RepID=UPI003F6E29BD
MNNKETAISEDTHALIGKIVRDLLVQHSVIQPQQLTDALHILSQTSSSPDTHENCLKVIKMLMKKMH